MPNPKTCGDCKEEFDGRKTKCPHCAEFKAVDEANDLLQKTQELEKEGSEGKVPSPVDATVMLELARSMQAMTNGMQSMMQELTLTLKEARKARTPTCF